MYDIALTPFHETTLAVEKQCVKYSRARVGVGARALACAFARVALLIHQATWMHHIV
jgi:hypothetical protein